MKRIILPMLFAVASFSLGCKSGCHDADDRRDAQLTAEVNAAKSTFLAAWTKTDGVAWTPDRLAAACDASPEFLSIDGMVPPNACKIIDGFDAYKGMWTQGMNGFKQASLSEVENLRTWAEEDQAVTVSRCRIWGVMPDGSNLELPGLLTLVLEKQDDGRWIIVHEHMSIDNKH